MKATQLEKSLANLIAINQPAFIWGGVGIGEGGRRAREWRRRLVDGSGTSG